MGRIFTAFLFIIIPFVKLFADTSYDMDSPCSSITDSGTCNSAAGCTYVTNENTCPNGCCTMCDVGKYGIGCSSCSSVDSNFTYSYRPNNTRGARTKYECYKKLDTVNDDTPQQGHGYKCRDNADSDVDGCREYYRDDYADTTDPATGLAYQGNANYHFVTCDASNVGLSDGSPSGYHMESNNQKCYSNTRDCNLFSSNNCSTTDSAVAQIVGTINWEAYTHNGQGRLGWNPNSDSCNCIVKGNLTEKNCNGTKSNPSISISYTGDSPTVSTTIIYSNPSAQDTWQTYSCTGCLAGYYANGDTNNSFNCVLAPQGYYSTGCGTVWISADNPTGSGTRDCTLYSGILKPCYAGMTSNSGADSVQDCHYTSQTQFCDAWGCASYSDLVGSNADDWWWYMQSGTTTGGSVNTSIDDIINDPSFE